MAHTSDAPVDLYIAVYSDADAAQTDWDTMKELVDDDVITLDGLVLVSRGDDAKIHVDDTFHETRKGAAIGAVGGLVVGLIFPPALLASGVVGAGLGAGVGGLVSHGHKEEIKEQVEDVLPPNSSAIVALFEERWVDEVEKALANSDKVTRHEVDRESADEVKSAAASSQAAS
jgi:uncharacterized membrane protein